MYVHNRSYNLLIMDTPNSVRGHLNTGTKIKNHEKLFRSYLNLVFYSINKKQFD